MNKQQRKPIKKAKPPTMPPTKQRRGFATMSPEMVKRISRMGGEAVSRDREHMARIGSKGGSSR